MVAHRIACKLGFATRAALYLERCRHLSMRQDLADFSSSMRFHDDRCHAVIFITCQTFRR